MKVHLIKMLSIMHYAHANAQSKVPFEFWLSALKFADWTIPSDIVRTFGSADLLGNGSNRVVFNVGGNHYRMVCSYFFGKTQVHLFVKWIGTHAEYTKLCKRNAQYTIDDF
jgi:mRNA interferase HigB